MNIPPEALTLAGERVEHMLDAEFDATVSERDKAVIRAALEAAAPLIAAAQREADAHLAGEHNAQCCHADGSGGSFADLLRDAP